MIGWTLCSGIGAPEVAAPGVDWRLASEIAPFPRAVLEARLGYRAPEDHNQGEALLWGDMVEVTPDLARARGVPLPDLLVAGTPCQSFSVAGLRRGTADPRGNLTLALVGIAHAIVDARCDGKLALLWENVPGVLSDECNAFGALLGGLVGADDALREPGGGSWPGAGMVAGPRARAAWRVFDAQYFGAPQRRRRVFLVVDFGELCDPVEILFEPRGLRGHPPPGFGGEETDPGGLARGVETGCGRRQLAPRIANPLTARMRKGINTTLDEGQTLIPLIAADGAMSVRKLMPIECERVQGFPDGHTAIAWRGREPSACPDGPRYDALGNSIAVPCIGWVLERMRESMAAMGNRAA